MSDQAISAETAEQRVIQVACGWCDAPQGTPCGPHGSHRTRWTDARLKMNKITGAEYIRALMRTRVASQSAVVPPEPEDHK